ncbi:MarR family transcriptional regulator [Brevibacterium daeguense]|uniref:MarR family transcriptional regulator n=1 Tax=Brevibacterium daeguense TaxID=909936 RepID=A0ABP8EKY6_9MICO|nr:MarR family transcriptional regulator [Brevibacterium daeguense]
MTESTDEDVRWLNERETQTWLDVWSLMVWLPSRLDAQLRAEVGLSHAEYNALSQMSMAPDRTIRLSELAAVSNMTLSHLSRVITRLEKAGWVTRSPDPADGRYTLGSLTAAGWEKIVDAAPGHVETVRRYVFDTLTPQQAEALGEAAAKIVAALSPPGMMRA